MTKKKSPASPEQLSPLATLAADPHAAALLRKRAEELARQPPAADRQALEPFVHFRLGRSEEYGVPHRLVEEVVSVPAIARVPCAPASIAGVINRRGQMLPVVDLRQLFGLDAEAPGNAAIDIVVISAGALVVGIRVDELFGVSEYLPDALATVLPSQGSLERAHVTGLLRGRITILDIEKILDDLCA